MPSQIQNQKSKMGRAIARHQDGKTYFMHPNQLGSTTMVTDQTGATIQKSMYYPFGQVWQASLTQRDSRFASMGPRDSETGNDPTLFRMYQPRLYRWLSPDPLAGSIMNPQSLNRYAYVANNPVNVIDPTGLDCFPEGCYPGRWDTGIYGGSGPPVGAAWGWIGSTSGHTSQADYVDGMEVPSGIGAELQRIGAAVACPDVGCGSFLLDKKDGTSAWARFQPTLGRENLAILSPWVDVVAMQASGAFRKYASTQGLDPNGTYQVKAYNQGYVLNIVVKNAPQLTIPAGYVKDPFTFTHNGNPSYVQVAFFNGGHLVQEGQAGVGYHTDFLGNLNPLHYVEFAVGYVTGASPSTSFTCTVNGGCSR